MGGMSFPSARRCAALLVCAVIFSACAPPAPAVRPSVRITVGDAPHEEPLGTTVGDVIERLALRPHAGRLLSVSGAILDAGLTPGTILLNGIPASSDTVLSTGDVILVKDGPDRTEGTRRSVELLPGRHLANPERTLGRYRIRRITVTGRTSGDVVSQREVPVGGGVAHGDVALTFDDGPWPVQTGHVVRILQRLHAPATFFMVGYLVERYPGIVRMVANAGMRIGDHSWDHPVDPPLADLTARRVADEIGRTADAVASIGIRPTLFRPPGGSYDAAVLREVERQGMRLVTWSVDPRDWSSNTSTSEIVHRVLDSVRSGSIILMHDGGGEQGATIRALPKIIRGIRRMGFRLVEIPSRA